MACLIAAPCSGSGKTLLSLSLTALARQRGETIQPFKVGPDYLDAQLLGAVAGRPCRNLDPILCGDAWLEASFRWHGGRAERVLVEGVMGLFDGRGASAEGSSAAVAAQLELPVVLVVEASRQAGSLAALVRGFRDHGPPRVTLAGVVLNRVSSDRHRALLAEALASINVPLLGVLPSHPALALPARHLGLLPPHELEDLEARQAIWAELAERHLHLEHLWPLLLPPPPPVGQDPVQALLGQALPQAAGAGPRGDANEARQPAVVAVAHDGAFHFRYPETGELLRAAGLEPVAWSPLADQPLPAATRAVVLPGGYPELHGEHLAGCHRSLGSLAAGARQGLPLVAECGGLLLLGHSLVDSKGQEWPMARLLPFRARPGTLSLGYREAVPLADGLLVRSGERYAGHEFHRWQIEALSQEEEGSRSRAEAEPLWQLSGWGSDGRREGWGAPCLHASWLHLHWAGFPQLVRRLATAAFSWQTHVDGEAKAERG